MAFGTFRVVGQRPSAQASDMVAGLFDYRELEASQNRQRAPAPMAVSLIFSLGTPLAIQPAGDPSQAPVTAPPCFVSGLRPEATDIASNGGASVVQVDLTPLGGYCLLGPALAELAAPVRALAPLLGPSAHALWEQLQETQDAHTRLALAERFVLRHRRWTPSDEIVHAYQRLARAAGGLAVADLAREIGWSHKHFVHRFKAEMGTTPKTFARMLRFHQACALARQTARPHWTKIAAEAGYCDQSHMNHDFLALAGEPPRQWLLRMAEHPQAVAW